MHPASLSYFSADRIKAGVPQTTRPPEKSYHHVPNVLANPVYHTPIGDTNHSVIYLSRVGQVAALAGDSSLFRPDEHSFDLSVPFPFPGAVLVELAHSFPVVNYFPPEKQLEDFPVIQEKAVHLPVR